METITKFIQYESHYLDLLQLTLSIIMDNKNILLKVDKSKIYLKFFQPHRLRLPSVSGGADRALFRGLVLAFLFSSFPLLRQRVDGFAVRAEQQVVRPS